MLNKKFLLLFLFRFVVDAFCYEEKIASKTTINPVGDVFDFKYVVHFQNKLRNIPSELLSDIKSEKLFKNSGQRIHNVYALNDRIKTCIKYIKVLARRYGFFDVNISYSLIKKSDYVNVIIALNLGVRYSFSKVDLICDKVLLHNPEKKLLLESFQFPGIKAFSIDYVLEVSKMLENHLQRNNYPYGKVTKQEVFLDKQNKSTSVRYTVIFNDRVRFGDTKIHKDISINDSFILNRQFWIKGDYYNKDLIQMTSHILSNSQIFSNVVIELDKANGGYDKAGDLIVPVDITLKGEKPRLFEMNLSYLTMKRDGFFKRGENRKKLREFLGKIKWTHYNVGGMGKRVSYGASGNPHNFFKRNDNSDYSLFCELEVPDTIYPCDSILYAVKAEQDYTNAYYKKGRSVSAIWGVPPIFQDLKIQLGVVVEKNTVTNPIVSDKGGIAENSTDYQAVIFPFALAYDRRDSVLNPKKGWYLGGHISPIVFVGDRHTTSTVLGSNLSLYKTIDRQAKCVISSACSVKYLAFSKLEKIPHDKRLYAGGINSIRGYGNQLAGTVLNGYKHPIGGKLNIEIRNEARFAFNKTIDIATFFETANNTKSFSIRMRKWYSSYGFGLRYNTAVGPIRFDVAMPVKRRRHVDKKYQVYISLGQAF